MDTYNLDEDPFKWLLIPKSISMKSCSIYSCYLSLLCPQWTTEMQGDAVIPISLVQLFQDAKFLGGLLAVRNNWVYKMKVCDTLFSNSLLSCLNFILYNRSAIQRDGKLGQIMTLTTLHNGGHMIIPQLSISDLKIWSSHFMWKIK